MQLIKYRRVFINFRVGYALAQTPQVLLIALYFLILNTLPAYSKDNQIRFDNLTSDAGLSQNSVYAILQDSDGFMWLGTRLGLNRYDGKSFKVFSHDAQVYSSIPSNRVNSLCEDRKGNIWVGTVDEGVAKFDRRQETFIRYSHDSENSKSLSSDYTTSLFMDSQGTIWVTTEAGLSRYDEVINKFTTFDLPSETFPLLRTHHIARIAEIPSGVLWLGFDNGAVARVTLADSSVVVVRKGSINNSVRVSCMLADPERDLIWVGMFGNTLYSYNIHTFELWALSWAQSRTEGMISGIETIDFDAKHDLWIGSSQAVTRYDPEANSFDVFRADPMKPGALLNDAIHTIYTDPQGNVWVGTEAGGVSKYSPGLIRFEHVGADPDNRNSLLSDGIFSIVEDENNQVWFGTIGGGISVFDPQKYIYQSYTSDDTKVDWSRNFVSKILPINETTLWMGTFRCGLYHMNPGTGEFTLYNNMDDDPSSLGDHTVYALLEDTQGTLWVGTQSQGLDRFNPVSNDFTHFRYIPNDPASIGSNAIYTLLEDHKGYIWIGTADEGLSRFDTVDYTATHIKADDSNNMSLSSNNILCLHEDMRGILWVGTRGGGINRINIERDQVDHIDLETGTQALSVYSILEDEESYLWLSTSLGIMKVHPDSGKVRHYTRSDGVIKEFYHESSLKASDGTMYFGGINGYNRFHPDSIKDNEHIPPIVLTGISVNYSTLDIGETVNDRAILQESITYSDQINFGPNDKVLRFTFTSLDYSDSKKNQYAYKMEGYDEDWINSGTENVAQYMNLPAGEYILRVRGTNNDGVWNLEGASIIVNIAPPFWKTWWFKTLGILSLLGFILAYIQLRTYRLVVQRDKLEALVRERTAQLKIEIEERQRVELEKTELKMDHLKRELLTQSLHLNDKQQIMDNLQGELESFSKLSWDEIKPRIKKLLRFLRDRSSVKQGWEEFEIWFTEIHTGFYSVLRSDHPKLSENELKVCALLRLNLISKDIAKVMNVQPTTIDIYRHRIRKKLEIGSEENLSTFLARY
ncbi:MAG: hypothetical protein HQ506_02255 [Candidatus Marinimicrobia bacterium]|nr:hypothetical protein [Candidatus Neomarinimicrobiota bacterium]